MSLDLNNSNEQTNQHIFNLDQIQGSYHFINSDSTNLSLKNEEYYCENIIFKNNILCGVECSICVNQIEHFEECCMISCKHSYHKKCIDRWLNIKKNCPICRTDCMKYDKEKKEFIKQHNSNIIGESSNEQTDLEILTNPRGVQIFIYPNGVQIFIYPNGVRIFIYPNGVRILRNPRDMQYNLLDDDVIPNEPIDYNYIQRITGNDEIRARPLQE